MSGKIGPVCEGYARALKVLCDKRSIPCVLYYGTASGNPQGTFELHMWNEVQMDDGNWYAVDVTWNDPGDGTDARMTGKERDSWLFLGRNDVVYGNNFTYAMSHVISLWQTDESIMSRWNYNIDSYIADSNYIPTDEQLGLTIDRLYIGDNEFQQFNHRRENYNIGVADDVSPDLLQVGVKLKSEFDGSVEITQPTSMPGTASVLLKRADGSVIHTYTLNFYPNAAIGWDANGQAGDGSKPNMFGWGAENCSVINWGDANKLYTHFMDAGQGTSDKYKGYTFQERDYNKNRMILLNFSTGKEIFSDTLTNLIPATTYIRKFTKNG